MSKRPTRLPKRSSRDESPPAQSRAGWSGPSAWAAAIVLAVSIGVVYCRSLDVPFIFDDVYAILHNKSITSLWPLVGTADQPGPLRPGQQLPTAARPLVNLSFAINYHFGEFKPDGYHAVNVVIHFLSSLLIFLIIRRTLRLPYFTGRYKSSASWLALLVAMIWALHPLQTEAVIYATQRTELMFAFCYLATLYCSLRYWSSLPLPPGEGSSRSEPGEGALRLPHTNQRSAWLFLAVVTSLAGMASKEVMVSAPLIVLLFERTFIAGSLAKAMRQSWPLYAGLAATWLLLLGLLLGAPHSDSAGFGIGVTGYEWWLTQSKVIWIYLKLVVCPWPLLIHYQLPYFRTFAESWVYVVPTLLVVVATLVLLWRNSPMGFLGASIFAILSPTLIIPIITEIAAERRMYLPLAALIVLFVLSVDSLVQSLPGRLAYDRPRLLVLRFSQVVVCVPLLALSLLLGLASHNRLNAYHDDINLWRDVLHVYPQDDVAQYNLGSQLMMVNRYSEAVDALHATLAQRPDDVDVLNNLGVALLRLNRFDEGLTHLQHAAQLQPNSFDVRLNLGLIDVRANRPAEAIEQLQSALKLRPDDAQTLSLLGFAFYLSGRYPEAIENIEHALRLKPDSIEDHNHLAIALARSGKEPQATDQYRTTLKLDSDNVEAHYNLGLLLTSSGKTEEAALHFEQILRLQPNVAEFHNAYGDLFHKVGRLQEAIDHYQAALRIQPDFLIAYSNLTRTLAAADRSGDAIATAQKAIEVARSTHQEAAAENLEEWLKHYQAELRRSGSSPSNPSNP